MKFLKLVIQIKWIIIINIQKIIIIRKKTNLKIFTKIMMKNRMTMEIDIMIWIKNKNSRLNLI